MARILVLLLVLVPLALVVYIVGVRMLASFSRPVPEPPPPGELRRVRLEYRCTVCGSEVRMTRAPTEDPEPPRCCMEPMDLVAAPER